MTYARDTSSHAPNGEACTSSPGSEGTPSPTGPGGSPLSAAEAWCWAAHLYRVESDAHYYAWPRTDDDLAAGDKLSDESNAMHARALDLDPSDDLWQRAMAKWDGGTP